jgi:DNA-binding Lrp family transcriptional regulator
MLSVVDAELLRMSRESAAIFRGRTQDPPRSYDEIAEELGIGPGACRKRFSEARARILRLLKPTP